jgi:hypothetical protein
MPTKISNITKRQALEKLREGMSEKDVAKMYAVSIRSLTRWQGLAQQSSTVRTRKATPAKAPTEATPGGIAPPEETATPLDFQESPVPIDDKKKSIVDQGLDSIKGMLGIKDVKGEKKVAPPLTAKLDPKRQAFVDNVTPAIALGFTIVASAWWQRIGPEYKSLAPDEEDATRIVAPLVRIYARHATFLTEINPDWADAGASLFAFVAYVYTSLGLYQKIKEEKEAAEHEQQGTYGYREYRSNGASAENGAYYSGSGYADVSGASQNNVGGSSQNGWTSQTIGRVDLTSKEQRQFEALSRLAQLDYASRARRSGFIQ